MPNVPKKGSPKPWIAKRKGWKGNKHQDADFYNSRDWRKLRAYVLAGEPLCRECGDVATVVDHVKPIRLGGSRWSHENLQPLCKAHHDEKSRSERNLKA